MLGCPINQIFYAVTNANDIRRFTDEHEEGNSRLTIYPGKMFGLQTFRLCNLGLITKKDIQDFFVVAREAFQQMGYSLPIN